MRRTPRKEAAGNLLVVLALVGLSGAELVYWQSDARAPVTTTDTTSYYDEALTGFRTAGTDTRALLDLSTWIGAIQRRAPLHPETPQLAALRDLARERLASHFADLARHHATRGEADACRQLADWGEDALLVERPGGGDSGVNLAERFAEPLRALYGALVLSDPADETLRRKAGWTVDDTPFETWVEEPYVREDALRREIKDLQAEAEKYHQSTRSGKRWLPPTWQHEERLARLGSRMESLAVEWRKRLEDPFEREAQQLVEATAESLREKLTSAYEWEGRVHRPYVLMIEKDKAWNETKVAEDKAHALLELHQTFYGLYGDLLGLGPITRPVPVIIFKRQAAYYEYGRRNGADRGAQAHYEPWSGRLVLSDVTGVGTLFHEGTHQLIHYNQKKANANSFLDESYWFQEGMAEYLSGNHRYLDEETGAWRYEVGLLQRGRLNHWRQNEVRAYSLWDLLDLTYADREKNQSGGEEDRNLFAYSQGWFLIYFLNTFAIDDEGIVQIGAPGKYQDDWLEYLAGEFEGRSGRLFLLECLGLLDAAGAPDMAAFEAFEKELRAYFEWINKKIALKHVDENRLIPWQEIERKGRKIGERIDDRLLPADEGR